MSRSGSGHWALIAFVVAVALGVAANRFESNLLYGPGSLAEPATVVIPRGEGSRGVARQLERAGVVTHWWLFELAVEVLQRGAPLQAGEYAFVPGQTLRDVIQQLRDGRTVVHHLTIPEGLTVSQIFGLLGAEPALAGEAGAPPSEGTLMPDTYSFPLAESRGSMVTRMRHAMERVLRDAWDKRAPGVPLQTPEQALILASIVEKETAVPEERPKVAAVFLNRLGRGMRLQADPTVIYALTRGHGPLGRALAHEDLAVDSPFNLYQHEGLPPTPIACPGKSAIEAVLHPDADSLLYFVADGSGHHLFAATLDEHNRNVTRLRRLEGKLPGEPVQD